MSVCKRCLSALDMKYSDANRWAALSLRLTFLCQYFQEAAISMSKCILRGIAKLCLMKYWEELCEVRGYRSRQGQSSCCATPDTVTDPSESLTGAQSSRCISSPTSLTAASGMERRMQEGVICLQRCCLLFEAIMVIWGFLNAYRPLCGVFMKPSKIHFREYLYLSEWILTDHLWILKYSGIV